MASVARRIALTGLPGSGKTTVAPLLAARLGWPWADLDAEIAARSGRSVAAIFAQDGEAAFRRLESATLADLLAREPLVLATGGGAVLDPASRELLRATSATVLLDVAPATAALRLESAGTARPVLQGDAPGRLRQLARERGPLYAGMHTLAVTDGQTPEQVAAAVLAALAARGLIAAPDAPEATIAVPLPHAPHAITVAWGALARLGAILRDLGLPPRVVLFTDRTVNRLFGAGLRGALAAAGITARLVVVPAGEATKALDQLGPIYDQLVSLGAERGEAIIALGGGVAGDLGGFVAATYLRGVPLVQVPTTLLAQVDAAIGGKTGVNLPALKNAVGAFYQPRAVVIDPAALLSLDDRLFREGLGEVVKYGIALDAALLADLEAQTGAILARDPPTLTRIIARCAALKAGIVAADEREGDRRMVLNYGHTVGHALEELTGYGALLHGEAVFLGMAVEARIAARLSLIDAALVARQDRLAAALGGPLAFPDRAPEDILAATRRDKKVSAGQVRWALPTGPGQSAVFTVPDAVALAALRDAQVNGV